MDNNNASRSMITGGMKMKDRMNPQKGNGYYLKPYCMHDNITWNLTTTCFYYWLFVFSWAKPSPATRYSVPVGSTIFVPCMISISEREKHHESFDERHLLILFASMDRSIQWSFFLEKERLRIPTPSIGAGILTKEWINPRRRLVSNSPRINDAM